MKFLRKGKVKEVYEMSEKELLFRFTDSISVFDKVIPSKIPCKGECLCRSAAHWFKACSKVGVKTHYLGLASPNEMIAHRVEVLPYDRISRSTRNYLIPLEVITRYYLAGSLWDRVNEGKVIAKSLGISEAPKYGMPLPEPYFELTTKLENVDRRLRMEEALRISGLSKDEMNELKEATLNIDTMITSEVGMRGLVHVDGKKEYAYDFDRRLMIVDTFGTADEDRWWLRKEYDEGNCVEFSKEFVRQHYRSTGYFDKLEKARAANLPEPEIPSLPDGVIDRVSKLYRESFEAITGDKFRPGAK